MLINGRHAEELRVAVVEDRKLQSYRVEVGESGVERGNIYRGVVANVEASLNAAFVDYGAGKHGFLTRHDVCAAAYHNKPSGKGAPPIEDVLQKGRPILVQVTKDAMGSKGAMLTTNISLAGRYMVLLPFDDSQRGVSRKVEDPAIRKDLRKKIKDLAAPEGFGFIVRTNAADQTKTALKGDLSALTRLWKQVMEANKKGNGARLLYDDQDLVVQAMRDYLDSSMEEVVLDDAGLMERAEEYMAAVMPRSKIVLTHYAERIPLYSRFNLEPQINAIQQRTVSLPSGGSLVIDPTEALTAIDVNSGKATAGANQEETAFNTNMEAAEEVARQLRLRDIGGLIVVDFIDMRARRRQAKVAQTMRNAMKLDKARHSVNAISSNGLLEINRQRIGQALQLRTHKLCPTCSGFGRVLNPDLVGLYLLRRLEARAATGKLLKAIISIHPSLAEEVQNRRRQQIAALEQEFNIEVEIHGNPDLKRTDERIQWVNRDQTSWPESQRRQPQQQRSQRGGRKPKGEGRSRPPRAQRERPAPQQPQEAAVARQEAAVARPQESEAQPPAAPEAVQSREAPAPAQDGEEQQGKRGGRKRRRRRRRRGRRGGGDSQQPPQQQQAQPQQDQQQPQQQQRPQQPGGEGDDSPEPTSGRRRRRRRRRGRGGDRPAEGRGPEAQEAPVQAMPQPDSASRGTDAPAPKPKPAPAPSPEPQPKAKVLPWPKPKPKPEPKPEPKPVPRPEPKPTAQPRSKPESKAKVMSWPKPAPKPEPKPEPKAEPKPKPEKPAKKAAAKKAPAKKKAAKKAPAKKAPAKKKAAKKAPAKKAPASKPSMKKTTTT